MKDPKDLAECGPDLAKYYLRSTTKVAHDGFRGEDWWVTSGRPLLLAELAPLEAVQVPRTARQVKRFPDAQLTLYRDNIYYKKHGNLIGIWILQFDSTEGFDPTVYRDLRICLFRLHSEREGLKRVLSLTTQPEVKDALALATDVFRKYLEHAVDLLCRPKFFGISHSEILEAAVELDDIMAAGERESIFRSLAELDVGERVLSRLEDLTKPREGFGIQIVVGDQTNVTGSDNVIVNRSTVQQAFNKVKNTLGEETAKALTLIEQEINESRNSEAAELFDSFNEEIQKPDLKKSSLKTLWQGMLAALPALKQRPDLAIQIVKLFT